MRQFERENGTATVHWLHLGSVNSWVKLVLQWRDTGRSVIDVALVEHPSPIRSRQRFVSNTDLVFLFAGLFSWHPTLMTLAVSTSFLL